MTKKNKTKIEITECEVFDWQEDNEEKYITFEILLKKLKKSGFPITSDKLLQLIYNGFIPCYLFQDENKPNQTNARFVFEEVVDWIKRNLIRKHSGKDLPIIVGINLGKQKQINNQLPTELAFAKNHLISIDVPVIYTGIYFLVRQNKIVYIGKSVNIQSRITSHLHDKIFDKVFILPILEDELDRVESAFINFIKPEYNSMIPNKSDDYKEIINEYFNNNNEGNSK